MKQKYNFKKYNPIVSDLNEKFSHEGFFGSK